MSDNPPKINLDEFFYGLTDEIYCIIKIRNNFPDYSPGDDIDIFCYDSITFSQKILETGNTYVLRGFEIKVTSTPDYRQTYIDFFYNEKLELRFDLYQSLPAYTNIRIRPALFSSIIEHAIPRKRYFQNQQFDIYVPNAIDDMLIRYIEYHEWYKQRPDKIKHLDYILNTIHDTSRISLMDKIHYYTELPPIEHAKNKPQINFMDKLMSSVPMVQIINSKFTIRLIIPPLKSLKNALKK
jgi:hypothetical protein